jgi:hypothetical protein
VVAFLDDHGGCQGLTQGFGHKVVIRICWLPGFCRGELEACLFTYLMV